MIIRIVDEGQYELQETSLAGMVELDEATQVAIGARDQERFRDLYGRPFEHIPPGGHPAGRR